jgi:hypothetical protein
MTGGGGGLGSGFGGGGGGGYGMLPNLMTAGGPAYTGYDNYFNFQNQAPGGTQWGQQWTPEQLYQRWLQQQQAAGGGKAPYGGGQPQVKPTGGQQKPQPQQPQNGWFGSW